MWTGLKKKCPKLSFGMWLNREQPPIRRYSAFAGIAPRLQPHLSILGFYMNDFPENLLPKDMSLRLIDDAGRQIWVTRYENDRWGNPVTLPEATVNAYLAVGAFPPANELERLIGTTHLGTLALRTLDFVLGVGEDESFERQVAADAPVPCSTAWIRRQPSTVSFLCC